MSITAYYPTTIASLVNPSANNYQDSPSHSEVETRQNLEIMALENELGLGLKGSLTSLVERLAVSINLDGTLKDELQHIENLSDVTFLSVLSNNQLLKYDNSLAQWINWTPDFIRSSGGIMTGDLVSTNFKIAAQSLGTPTYSTINDWFKLMNSAGRLTGGTISQGTGETVNVALGTGLIRIADDDVSQVKFFDWAASTGLSVPTNTTRYIGIDYNTGTAAITVEARTTQNWDYDTEFPLGSVINVAGVLYILNDPWWVGDGLTNVIERFQSEGTVRDDYVGGLIIGTSGTNTTRKPTLTGGTVWSRLNEFAITAIDCSVADTFYGFYRNGSGGWTRTAAKTDIDDFYDNNSGTLQALSANRFANFWVFVDVDSATGGQLMLIYPQNQYTVAAVAEAETVPVFPSIWYKHGVLVGRITIKQGTTIPTEVASTFSTMFSAALAADHAQLSNIGETTHADLDILTSNAHLWLIT